MKPLAVRAVLFQLRVVRKARALSRAHFGTEGFPHWLHDFIRIAKINKWLLLFSTLLGVLLAPRHFFRRLDRTLEGHSPLYATPVYFLSASIVAIVGMGILHVYNPALVTLTRKHDLSLRQGVLFLLSIWALSPVWLALMSLVLYIALSIVTLPSRIQSVGGLVFLWGPVARATHLFTFISSRKHLSYGIPLTPSVYRRLDWRRYLWGMFYLGPYAIIMLPVYVGGIYLAYLTALPTLSEDSDNGNAQSVLFVFALTLGLIGAICVKPYIAMLHGCVRIPTVLMHRADIEQLRAKMKDILKLKDLSQKSLGRALAAAVPSIIRDGERILESARIMDFEVRADTETLQHLQGERARVFATLPLDDLLKVLAVTSMPEEQRKQCELIFRQLRACMTGLQVGRRREEVEDLSLDFG